MRRSNEDEVQDESGSPTDLAADYISFICKFDLLISTFNEVDNDPRGKTYTKAGNILLVLLKDLH